MQGYFKFKINNKFRIAPNAGLQFEQAGVDSDKNFEVGVSGGNILLGTAGIETAFKKIAIGVHIQIPVSQNLAKGIVHANERGMFHIAFLL